MRAFLALLVVWPSLGVSVAQGQADYYARLGLTFATKLVIDNIVQDIETKQSLAPTLALGASLPISPSYSAGLEATLTTSGLHSSEANQETDLGTVRTGSIVLGLEGPVAPHVSWRAGLGLIQYWPAEDSGIFLMGGTTRFLAGAGIDYRPAVMTNWDL